MKITLCGVLMLTAFSVSAEISKHVVSEKDGYKWVIVVENGKVGAQTQEGVWLVPAQYKSLYYFEGYFNAESALGIAYYNLKGQCLINDNKGYKSIVPLQKGSVKWFRVNKNGYVGACDRDGHEILAPSHGYSDVSLLDGDVVYYFNVKKNDKVGICDIRGNEIISPAYKDLIMVDGIIKSKEGNEWVDIPKSMYPNWPTSKSTTGFGTTTVKPKTKDNSESMKATNATASKPKSSNSSITKTKAKSQNTSSASNKSETVSKKRFYSTWMILPSTGAYWVVGNGLEDKQPILEFIGNKIKVFGIDKTEVPVLSYVKKDDKGLLIYEGKAAGEKGKLISYRILINPQHTAFNFLNLSGGTVSSIRNFVADIKSRQKIVEANKGFVNQGNPNFLNNNSDRGSSSTNNNSGSGKEGRGDRPLQQSCSFCGGTEISPVMSSNAGSRTVYTNRKGDLCPHCGTRTYHFHDRCPSCK